MKRISGSVLFTAALLGGGASAVLAGPFGWSSQPSATPYAVVQTPAPAPYTPVAVQYEAAPYTPAAAQYEVAPYTPVAVQPVAAPVTPIAAQYEATPEGLSVASQDQVLPTPSVETASLETATVTLHPNDQEAPGGTNTPGASVQLVNSRNLVLDFEVKGVGTSGLGNVELWYTRNGQIWQKYHAGTQTQSPFTIDVPDDGLYGFTVVAVNGVGISKNTPRPGDVPQVWVEVDTIRPEVHLQNTQAGVDDLGRTLTLRWSATDKNLSPRPVTLYYAEQAGGQWTPFATNVDNSGHFVWHMSPGLPNQVLVRVEVTDRVGNVGADQTSMPAPLDLSRPSASITRIGRNGTIQPVGAQVPARP